jgi:asparagine synthetase B (glutamine-hydrolysing)
MLFASEPAPLLVSGLAPRDLHPEAILAHVLFARPEPAWSYFRGIHRLPEAHYLLASAAQTTVNRYWGFDEIPVRRLARPAAARELKRRLGVAVARRGAGETGVLLSGGLDSSSVAAEATTLLGARGSQLHAYTWASAAGDGIDERHLSSGLIRRYPNIVERPIPADDLWPLSRYPAAYADPNAPVANTYPDLLLATIEAAREDGVAVLMNGIGGDTVVGMLAPASQWRRRDWLRLFRQGLMRGGSRRALPVWLSAHGRRLAREAGMDRLKIPWHAWISSRKTRCFALSHPTQVMHLERFDRLSRRTGVRVTAPWHDFDLASLVAGLPGGAMDVAPPPKSLLREAMADCLPEKILALPKSEISTSRLASKGWSRIGQEVAAELFSLSRFAIFGLTDNVRLSESFRTEADMGRPGWWTVVTTEAWLRALSEFLARYDMGFDYHERSLRHD